MEMDTEQEYLALLDLHPLQVEAISTLPSRGLLRKKR
jgi:hypothetical protein